MAVVLLTEIRYNFISMGNSSCRYGIGKQQTKRARGDSIVAGTIDAIQRGLLGNGSWYLVKSYAQLVSYFQ